MTEQNDAPPKPRPGRPRQTLTCGWCGDPIPLRSTGRIPKWCSETCRHRAWEQSRAAASGRAAVQVVDRVIEVEVPVEVVREVPVETVPKGSAWPPALHELALQLDRGHIYDRDLGDLAAALDAVLAALRRRSAVRRRY